MGDIYTFDSSTLILLAKITALRSFSKAKKTLITQAIKKEVFRNKKKEDAVVIKQLLDEGIIRESTGIIDARKIMKDFGIEDGEAEVIGYAWKEKEIVATDDYRAIKACKILDIKFVTAVHCLLFLEKESIIEKKVALEKLKKLKEYGRYDGKIIADAELKIKGEKNG